MRWTAFVCRLAVGGIFLYACLDKVQHPQAFAVDIFNYRLVPWALLHPWAHFLPVLEATAGLALVLGVARRGAALVLGGLTVVFIVAIATALLRGLDISCGCFATDSGHAVGLDLLLRDVLLLVACLPPLLARDAGPALEHLWRGRP
ncbi:MAG: MauE/DoxX family redox-associated membrane protein [Candidatus Krumholzibacteriia bacterium]